jgi:hypothetical protein
MKSGHLRDLIAPTIEVMWLPRKRLRICPTVPRKVSRLDIEVTRKYRHFDATLFPSSKRGSPTVGPLGFQLQVVPST